MKAVICGRNYTSRLGMIRAIGSLGVEIIVIYTNNRRDPDCLSRYVRKYIQSPESDKTDLLKKLLFLAKEEKEKMLLLPTDDYCASVADGNLDQLKEKYWLQNIDMRQGAVISIMDKQAQKQLARNAGLPVVGSTVIEINSGRFSIPEGVGYPCFTKPLISSMGRKGFLKRCEDRKELEDLLTMSASIKPDCDILVEDYKTIEKEYAVVGYCDGKQVVIPGMIQMLMDGFGRHKGVTCLGKVFPAGDHAEFMDKIRTMMLSTGFVGLFDVDAFMSDGQMYFNELNMRFGASGYAMTALGVNLPEMLVASLTSSPQRIMPKEITEETVFANEKGLVESWQDGHISWKEMKGMISSAGIRFVRSMKDPLPYLGLIYKVAQHKLKNRS